jgi:hypothetical protein
VGSGECGGRLEMMVGGDEIMDKRNEGRPVQFSFTLTAKEGSIHVVGIRFGKRIPGASSNLASSR